MPMKTMTRKVKKMVETYVDETYEVEVGPGYVPVFRDAEGSWLDNRGHDDIPLLTHRQVMDLDDDPRTRVYMQNPNYAILLVPAGVLPSVAIAALNDLSQRKV